MIPELTILIKLLLATLIGLLIGGERKRKDKPGGGRTFALVCLSSCLVAIISLDLSKSGYFFNFTRLMSYTIAGISFIGNGLIIKDGNQVEGLTTASALLFCVILGFLLGLGYYLYAIMATVLVYIILEFRYWKEK